MVTNTAPLIYHGVTTHSWSSLWGLTGQADAIKAEVDAYEAAAGRTVAWVGFGHEWQTDGRAFPSDVAISISNRGATPLIFLNLRSVDVIDEEQQAEPLYTLAAIISGQFDSDFAAWADGAKSLGSEIIVDWGWEMNGDWAPWNGIHNGGQSEGPQRFQQAYRHIVELMRSRGASNIRWAFHVNFPEYPAEPWNAFENYYPGDDVVDYIGVSIYGAQSPTDTSFPSFVSNMDSAYPRLVEMAPQKPVFVFEFGVTWGNPLGDQAQWADDALAGILSGRWPAVRSFAWWNDYWECWCQDGNPAHDTEMRVEAAPGLAAVFWSRLSGADNLGDRPPITPEPESACTNPPTAPSESEAIQVSGVSEARYAAMGPGLNLTGWFWPREQISGPGHLEGFYTEADLQMIQSLGFQHVRLPVDPLLLFDEGDPEQLVEENLNYLDKAIDKILASGLAVTIDIHASFVSETGEFFETKPLEDRLASDPDYFQAFVRFWRALAQHFSTRDPEKLFLEILNEPQAETEVWDSMQAELVLAIREGAPEHTIIATGALWGSLEGLLEMTPVSDPNLVYSVHLYEPFVFTTQGAEWVAYLTEIRNLPYPSSPELVSAEVERLRAVGADDTAAMVEAYGAEQWDRAKVKAMIQTLANWGDEHNVRLIVNEFGVYSKAPPADRIRFIRDMRQSIEQRGIAWNMWDYSAGGYGIFGNGDSEVRRDIGEANPLVLEALGIEGQSPELASPCTT